MKRKETADARDRAIVAKAGPWNYGETSLRLYCYGTDNEKRIDAAIRALARIANRIVKEGKG